MHNNDIMFWRFLAASCRGEETVCVKLLNANEKITVCTYYTDRGCMTCGDKQEMHDHRYLNSLVIVALSLTSFQKFQKHPWTGTQT